MKWFKRGLWFLAWSVWAWLGLALYRELPREWGPPLARLPMTLSDEIIGFIDDDSPIVVGRDKEGRLGSWDGQTGTEKVSSVTFAADAPTGAVSLNEGVAIGTHANDRERPTPVALETLDLRTGRRAQLQFAARRVFDVHPKKPWVAVEISTGTPEATRVCVIDFRTATQIATIEVASPANLGPDQLRECWFTDVDDELLLFVEQHKDASEKSRQRLERRRVGDGQLISTPIELTHFHDAIKRPVAGKVLLFGDVNRPDYLELTDCRTGQSLRSGAKADWEPGAGGDLLGPLPTEAFLSDSGRSVMVGPGFLWSVNNSRLLWSSTSIHEAVGYPDPSTNRFTSLETWRSPSYPYLLRGLRLLGQSVAERTYAFRDMETGSVLFRGLGDNRIYDAVRSKGRFALMKKGSVPVQGGDRHFYVIDGRPLTNVPFLALCQTVLAMPLIALWAMLQWRRKRRTRLAALTK